MLLPEMLCRKLQHRSCAFYLFRFLSILTERITRWNRNWRYHKELRLWITKESGTTPSQKVPGGENGQYTYWDPENWIRERKDMVVIYADLEEKNVPAFAPGQTLSLAPRPGQQAQPLVGSAA